MLALQYVQRFGLRKTFRRVFRPRISRLDLYRSAVAGKKGLEIGGPSTFFESLLPAYIWASQIDNVVYSACTIWADNSGGWDKGGTLILDGTDLHSIPDASYSFVLSCHSLEHIANPVKALKEWQRVTRPGGHLVLILPHYRFTFDRRRPLTTVQHMMGDYARGTAEDDNGHLQEVLELHDISADPNATSKEQLTDFVANRSLHHHTFNEINAPELLKCSGYSVKNCQIAEPFHIVLLAQKVE